MEDRLDPQIVGPLANQASQGDMAALDTLLRRIRPVVTQWARAYLREESTVSESAAQEGAEDITQEALRRVAAHINDLIEPLAFEKWLSVLVRNASRSYRARYLHRTGTPLQEIGIETDRLADREAEYAMEHALLLNSIRTRLNALDSVNKKRQIRRHGSSGAGKTEITSQNYAIFVLHFLQGLTSEEVGYALGLSAAAVRQILRRKIMPVLRDILGQPDLSGPNT